MLSKLAGEMMDLFLPREPQCAHCAGPMHSDFFHKEYRGAGLCGNCLRQLEEIIPPYCKRCGKSTQRQVAQCPNCESLRDSFTLVRAVGYHRGLLQEMLHQYKFVGKRSLGPSLGRIMATELIGHRDYSNAAALIPIPLHGEKLVQRGFNQAEELALELGKNLGIPVVNAIKREQNTAIQSKLSKRERLDNVRDAFTVEPSEVKKLQGKDVILIDDVVTTGATCHYAARELLSVGVSKVNVFALALGVNN
ncbi:ComF family protein [Desulfitispora alkaliphila]|uniref:ComF family protein n=1 Tax=Desulfitispora alkaliphila TaxID=622674 RepID=UPI003D261348